MNSKIIIFLFVCVHLSSMGLAEEGSITEEKIRKIHEICVEKTKVPEELITAVNDAKNFDENESLKCYIQCTMQEPGAMDDDGVLDIEAALKLLPEDHKKDFESILRACANESGPGHCETAWLIHKCFAEKYPKYRLI